MKISVNTPDFSGRSEPPIHPSETDNGDQIGASSWHKVAGFSTRLRPTAPDPLLNSPVPELELYVNVTAPQVAACYRGEVRAVVARATNGQTVQFPLSVLHKHITHDGIQGDFG